MAVVPDSMVRCARPLRVGTRHSRRRLGGGQIPVRRAPRRRDADPAPRRAVGACGSIRRPRAVAFLLALVVEGNCGGSSTSGVVAKGGAGAAAPEEESR